MSLLDQLWDDTVAGPRPDTGLGKLRKHRTFSFRSTAGNDSDGGGSVKSYGGGGDEAASAAVSEESTRVTRSIMIVRPPGYQSGSPPVSPAGSTPPVSPFSGSSRGSFRFRRRSASDAAYEKDAAAAIRDHDHVPRFRSCLCLLFVLVVCTREECYVCMVLLL